MKYKSTRFFTKAKWKAKYRHRHLRNSIGWKKYNSWFNVGKKTIFYKHV